MKEYKLSEALGAVPDDLLLEATQIKRKNPAIRRFLRVAAIAAVLAILLTVLNFWSLERDPQGNGIIAVPGVMRVYACELEGKDETQLSDYVLYTGMDPLQLNAWCPYSSLGGYGIPISLIIEEQALQEHFITFEISVNYGELRKQCHYEDDILYGKEVTLNNYEEVFWSGYEILQMRDAELTLEQVMQRIGPVYVSIIIYADGNIIGYALLEMVCTNPEICLFNASMIESAYFPKIDGSFQNLTEQYIHQQLEKSKDTAQ